MSECKFKVGDCVKLTPTFADNRYVLQSLPAGTTWIVASIERHLDKIVGLKVEGSDISRILECWEHAEGPW